MPSPTFAHSSKAELDAVSGGSFQWGRSTETSNIFGDRGYDALGKA
jgi:hypothetical protein